MSTATDWASQVIASNGGHIPSGCICSYTWGTSASLTQVELVRNGPISTCPADHEDAK